MDDLSAAWDGRIAAFTERRPAWIRNGVDWLRRPSRRWLRIVASLLLVLSGMLAALPTRDRRFLLLGLAFLADEWPALKPPLERAARWGERAWRRIRPLPGA